MHMTDEAGGDEKIIAVPSPHISAMYKDVHTMDDLPKLLVDQIAHFFERYKDLEGGKWVKIEGFGGAEEAREAISKAIRAA